jgi:hypothetical protein
MPYFRQHRILHEEQLLSTSACLWIRLGRLKRPNESVELQYEQLRKHVGFRCPRHLAAIGSPHGQGFLLLRGEHKACRFLHLPPAGGVSGRKKEGPRVP